MKKLHEKLNLMDADGNITVMVQSKEQIQNLTDIPDQLQVAK